MTTADNPDIMDNILTGRMKLKLKWLGYYQIAGGIFGIGITIWLMAQTNTITGLVILIFGFAAELYSFSIYCGRQLLKGEKKRALKLSMVSQAFQAVHIASLGYAYMFVSGVGFLTGISYNDTITLSFNFCLSQFQFNINSDSDDVIARVNLVAFLLLYLIGRLLREIEYRERIYAAAQYDNSSKTPEAIFPVHGVEQADVPNAEG